MGNEHLESEMENCIWQRLKGERIRDERTCNLNRQPTPEGLKIERCLSVDETDTSGSLAPSLAQSDKQNGGPA
jgi:hypothetical protein